MTNNASKQELKTDAPKKKGLNPLLIMLIVFGLPYALAWYFLYGGDPTEFEAPSNNGRLISPMVPLPNYSLELIDGKSIHSESLSNNWLIFTVTKKCQAECKKTLLIIRQVRKAMAVDRDVIRPILLLEDDKALHDLDINLTNEFNSLYIATSQSTKNSGLLDIFAEATPTLENSIFMVDPFGNFMMTYPAGTNQLGLLEDMERLLKVNPVHR